MRAGDFQFLAELVSRRSGLALTQDRMTLIKARLAPVATRFGFRALGLTTVVDLRSTRELMTNNARHSLTIEARSATYRKVAGSAQCKSSTTRTKGWHRLWKRTI